MTGAANGGRRPWFFAAPPSSRPGATLGEAIHEAFVIEGSPAQRVVIAKVGALVAVILGVGVTLSIVIPGEVSTHDVGALVAAAVACSAAVVLTRGWAPPVVALDLTLVGAMVLLAVVGAHGGQIVVHLPAIYVMLGTATFMIRPLRASLRHMVFIGASWAYALGLGDPISAPLTRWVAVMAAVLVSGLFVRWLVERVTDLATAEHASRQDVERSTRELERQSHEKSEFLARMSHELRTPLNVVVGFAEVLRDGLGGPLTERQRNHVEDIAGSGRDLLFLVDELLDVSKVEAGEMDLAIVRTDLTEVVLGAEALLQGRARDAGVALVVRRPSGPVVADADPLRIRQVVWNLVGNALKFTPRGGSVVVTVEGDERHVRVHVRDSGPGISPEEQDRIFELYVQGATAGEGSGIGLALSRRFVHAHGGRLWLESRPGDGSTFSFEIPRHGSTPTTGPLAPGGADPDEVAWADVDQAILVPGSTANRRAVAYVGRWFANAAAILLPALAVITPGPVAVRAAIVVHGLAALSVSRLLGRAHTPPPLLVLDLLSLFGTVAISAGVIVAGQYGDLVALGYGWTVLASGALHTAPRVLAQMAVVFGCYAAALLISRPDQPVDHFLAVAMLVSANVVVVGWVGGRLREAISELFGARLAAEVARSRVARVSAHKSEFLANTSHELCTPLNAIIGFTQVLRDERTGPLTERQAQYLEDILESGQALLALITDLLDLAKLEAGRLPRSPQPVSVATLVDAAVAEVGPVAQRRSIAVVPELPADLPTVHADPTHLYHALHGLVANGVKFTSDGGRVEVRARATTDRLRVSVRDTGIGILPEQRPHLFEAFHQGTRPLPPHARGGTGLGLTLAKGLIELEGGTIEVDSTPDVGSTFTIELPLPHAALSSAAPAADDRPAPTTSGAAP